MVYSRIRMQARNRKAMSGGADYPKITRKPLGPSFGDTNFVDALCGAIVPLLVRRNGPVKRPQDIAQIEEPRVDPRQAHRVEEFVQLLLDEDDNGCEDFAFRQAASGADPQRMATEYLGPAARLIGDYWRMDICDFMQVTVCMTRIQRLFWRLVDECPPTCEARPGCSILLSPVPGEQHSFGHSVVEDAFRRQGWHVDSCSFDEEEDLYLLAGNNDYQIIGLSISGEVYLPAMASTIIKLRRRSRNTGISILAGGSLGKTQPDAVRGAGADLVAIDLAQALALSETAVAARIASGHISCASR